GEWILESTETGRYQIYDMVGTQIANGTFQAGTQLFSGVKTLSPAVYIASFSYKGKQTVQKIIVNSK
ncbi:MAG: T9SS type A sorting domain-containing protein, partial [Tannerella sp.]|nr:T9SS type A sorting domain-containing protein [Tannerella sp.]